jgi:membrane protease YdiL (CAAX protease family)
VIDSWRNALQIALALFLFAGVPFAARRRTRKLLADLARDPNARFKFSLRSMAGAWIITAALLLLRPPPSVGVRTPQGSELAWTITFGIFAAFGLGIVASRRRSQALGKALARLPERARAILPVSAGERAAWVAVSATAGFCEEVLYRGFLPALLTPLLGGASWAAWALSTLAFGLGHVYQGPRAVLGTAVLGGIFAVPTIVLSSIWPAAFLHALFNLRALTFPAEVGLRSPPRPAGPA